jgi:hypothetical protein
MPVQRSAVQVQCVYACATSSYVLNTSNDTPNLMMRIINTIIMATNNNNPGNNTYISLMMIDDIGGR